jgi:N-acetylmuramoyl-L-alanine amidase
MKAPILLALALLCLTAAGRAENTPYFFSASARNGDGIILLLRRYALDRQACNVEKFLELNRLEADAPLYAGKQYKLPVMIYTYNGQSIRSTLGIDDMERALRIADYNEMLVTRGLRQSDYKSSGILWVPFHELNYGETPATASTKSTPDVSSPEIVNVSAASASTEMVSIFGNGYDKITRRSNKLKGKVYYISSGHGGPDPGAMARMGNHSICEDEYAYDVGLRLARNLMENGATVHIVVQDGNDGIRNDEILTCDNDEKTMGTHTMPINQLARLKQRTDAINALYAKHARAGAKEQYLVCLHVDSRAAHDRQDVFFYHFEHSKAGKRLAYRMQDVFADKYARYRADGSYEGTVSTRNLYMLRMPYPTTLYVELANIKNALDRKRILPAANRQALANWLYEGLVGN